MKHRSRHANRLEMLGRMHFLWGTPPFRLLIRHLQDRQEREMQERLARYDEAVY